MVIRYLGDALYKGLSTDTKPVGANTAMFIETDTRKTFIYDGVDWNLSAGGVAEGGGGTGAGVLTRGGIAKFTGNALTTVFPINHGLGLTPDAVSVEPASIDAMGDYVVTKNASNIIITFQEPPPSPASGIENVKFEWGAGLIGGGGVGPVGHTRVYKIADTYYAEDSTNTVISSGATLETVLQAALNLRGNVYIEQGGTFAFTATGVNIPPSTSLYLGRNTVLEVPASFLNPNTGIINFQVSNGATEHLQYSHLYGGTIQKAGATPDRLWYAISFKSLDTDTVGSPGDARSIVWSGVHGTRIIKPYAGIRIDCQGDGWISDCDFDNVVVEGPVYGFEWVDTASSGGGFHRSRFNRCSTQPLAGNPVTDGFHNVSRSHITFDKCYVWDQHGSGLPSAGIRTMVIAANASYIKIKGGIIARNDGYFENKATSNTIEIESDDWNVPTYADQALHDSVFTSRSTYTYARRTGYVDVGYYVNNSSSGDIPANNNNTPLVNVQIGGRGLLSIATQVNCNTTGTPWGKASDVALAEADGTLAKRFSTGAKTNNRGGIRCTRHFTFGKWAPVFKAKLRLNQAGVGTQNFYCGFTTLVGGDVTSDFPVGGAFGGVMFVVRSTDTNFMVMNDDGVAGGAAAVVTNTTIPIDTAIHTFEISAYNELTAFGPPQVFTTRYRWRMDSGSWATLSTNLPGQDTAALGIVCSTVSLSPANTDKTFDLFGLYVESK